MEIERKYLVSSLPQQYKDCPTEEIEQAYLCRRPVIRIRRSNDEYYLTYKNKGLLARDEYNLPLDEASFIHLLPKADGKIIKKTRYRIPLFDGLTAELDIFSGALAPLSLVEVEFPSVQAADAFIPPDWFGEDVTESGKYQNSRLSLL